MRARQQGVAIVLAMAVVAVAALAVTAMMVSQSTWSRQLELGTGHAQAQGLTEAGLDWARAVLSDDLRTGNIDHLGEPWALQLPPIPVENGSLAGHIDDQQGKFNLNNLVKQGKVNSLELARFRRLLTVLELSPSLADAVADWIDADNVPQPRSDAEDAYYLSLQPAHLAANRPLTDLGELALVRGFDGAVRARMRPFITALPSATPVNVNTAPPEVLCALVDGLKLDDARVIVQQRERIPFRDPGEFVRQLPSGLAVAEDSITVSSEYFIATMGITMAGAQARGTALLAREGTGWPTVVWRKYP